jgi:hypothetical protein
MNSINSQVYKIIAKVAIETGFTGELDKSNFNDVFLALVSNHSEVLADALERGLKLRVNGYTSRGGYADNLYGEFVEGLESLFALLDAKLDYPGLYPTYEFTLPNGNHVTEYNTLNAFRRYNNFWNNNQY